MSGTGRQTARTPATKLAYLWKKMKHTRILTEIDKSKK